MEEILGRERAMDELLIARIRNETLEEGPVRAEAARPWISAEFRQGALISQPAERQY